MLPQRQTPNPGSPIDKDVGIGVFPPYRPVGLQTYAVSIWLIGLYRTASCWQTLRAAILLVECYVGRGTDSRMTTLMGTRNTLR